MSISTSFTPIISFNASTSSSKPLSSFSFRTHHHSSQIRLVIRCASSSETSPSSSPDNISASQAQMSSLAPFGMRMTDANNGTPKRTHRWQRVLLKVSGEALAGDREQNIDPKVTMSIAREVAAVTRLGIEVATVVGGGNIFRGSSWAGSSGLDRSSADYIGMLATVMNAIFLQATMESLGVPTRVQTAFRMSEVVEPYIRRRAVRHLEKGRVVIFAAGTGNPFFTTDTAAALCCAEKWSKSLTIVEDKVPMRRLLVWLSAISFGPTSWMIFAQMAQASEEVKLNAVFEVGELFELGIQLSYLLLLLALLGAGSFFVIRQVLARRELDLSAKELQEQVRSGDASATELFELGAVMLRRKFYPAATKYLLQAIDKWDGDDQDIAQVYNALGVSYVRDDKLDKGITQFETAVKVQPGYVTAWNNLGDALEKKKDYKAALKAFEEVLLFDPNNKIARPRRDALKDRVEMYKGVKVQSKSPVKSKER